MSEMREHIATEDQMALFDGTKHAVMIIIGHDGKPGIMLHKRLSGAAERRVVSGLLHMVADQVATNEPIAVPDDVSEAGA